MAGEAVRVTGWLNEKAALKISQELDIYLSAALWEGQPFAVLEAMNNGKCLVLSRCEGNVDLVEQGENGYLYADVAEAINYIKFLSHNRDQIKKMGELSRKKCIENHDYLEMGKAYEKQYEKLLAQSA